MSTMGKIIDMMQKYVVPVRDLTMLKYYKMALPYYDRQINRTMVLPFKITIYDDSDDNESYDMIEFNHIILTDIAPEIYYYFKYTDDRSSDTFRKVMEYWEIKPCCKYHMTDIFGNRVILNVDEDKIYCT